MPYINKEQLDGELRSSLSFEFVPIYEGGILSGAPPATPFQDGALLAAGVDSSIYVKFKSTPLMVPTADVWFYFSYYAGASTADIDFAIYYEIFPEGDPGSGPMGPILTSITPDGTPKLQTTISVINNNVLAWKVPSTIKKNSYVRFEIVRKGTTDLNPDDLKILDVNYATIPTYMTVFDFDNGLNQPIVALPTGTQILDNKGELLSHDGIQDVRVAPPGAGTFILVHNGSGSTGIEWVASSSLVSTSELYNGTILTSNSVLVAGDKDYIYKVENTSGGSIDIELPLVSTVSNGAFFVFQLMPTNVDSVNIKPNVCDNLYDLSAGSISAKILSTIGETVKIITDGISWYVYNVYEEPVAGGTGAEITEEYEVGVSPGVVAGASTVVTATVDTVSPQYHYLNGVLSEDSFFSVGGVGNREFTWTGPFSTVNGDIITIVYYV
jgi:hypothetical protein